MTEDEEHRLMVMLVVSSCEEVPTRLVTQFGCVQRH